MLKCSMNGDSSETETTAPSAKLPSMILCIFPLTVPYAPNKFQLRHSHIVVLLQLSPLPAETHITVHYLSQSSAKRVSLYLTFEPPHPQGAN